MNTRFGQRTGGFAALVLAAAVATGCSDGSDHVDDGPVGEPSLPAGETGNYSAAAANDAARGATGAPWWCQGLNGAPDLDTQACADFSYRLDNAEYEARRFPTVADITAAGGVLIEERPSNIGLAYTLDALPNRFNEFSPNVYLYGGPTNGNRLVGVAWAIDANSAPSGFPGNRDTWVRDNDGNWWLTAWIIRGHENQPDLFAAAHPCLTDTDTTLTSTTDDCFVASHPEAFEVMVTNDDGYQAHGIDAVVEALYALPNVVVHVVAPYANQSGSGDATTPEPYEIDAIDGVTLSGRPAVGVTSNDPADAAGSGSPADSVVWGLTMLNLSPEVVVSGTNEGQNMAGLGSIVSGTIGAARTARRLGVPAIGTSTGPLGVELEFAAGAAHTLALLERWRLGLELNTLQTVLNINIPSCGGAVNGTVYTVVAPDLAGRNYNAADCNSTAQPGDIHDDVDAFNHGYVGITDMGRDQPPNFP